MQVQITVTLEARTLTFPDVASYERFRKAYAQLFDPATDVQATQLELVKSPESAALTRDEGAPEKPKKAKRDRPRRKRLAEQPEPEQALVTSAETASVISTRTATVPDVVAVVDQYYQTHGPAKLFQKLQRYGVKRVVELNEENTPKFVAELQSEL